MWRHGFLIMVMVALAPACELPLDAEDHSSRGSAGASPSQGGASGASTTGSTSASQPATSVATSLLPPASSQGASAMVNASSSLPPLSSSAATSSSMGSASSGMVSSSLGSGETVIVADQTWTAAHGPYLLTGDILIPAGVTLTMRPGVEVRCANRDDLHAGLDPGHIEILVRGTLRVEGSDVAPVTLRASLDEGTWTGMVAEQGAVVSLEQAFIQDADMAASGGGDWSMTNVNITGSSHPALQDRATISLNLFNRFVTDGLTLLGGTGIHTYGGGLGATGETMPQDSVINMSNTRVERVERLYIQAEHVFLDDMRVDQPETGLFVYSAHEAVLDRVRVTRSLSTGAQVYAVERSEIRNAVITGGNYDGLVISTDGLSDRAVHALVQNVTVDGNGGSGITLNGSGDPYDWMNDEPKLLITNALVTNNRGAGISWRPNLNGNIDNTPYYPSPTVPQVLVTNTDIWGNAVPYSSPSDSPYNTMPGGPFESGYTGLSVMDTLSVDPGYVDAPMDVRLAAANPSLHRSVGGPTTDADHINRALVNCDLGAFEHVDGVMVSNWQHQVGGVWQSGSVHVFDRDAYVPAGNTLTIEAGARVLIKNGIQLGVGADPAASELIVDGTLIINGTAEAPVILAPDSGEGAWGGIHARGGATIRISHAQLENIRTRAFSGDAAWELSDISMATGSADMSTWGSGPVSLTRVTGMGGLDAESVGAAGSILVDGCTFSGDHVNSRIHAAFATVQGSVFREHGLDVRVGTATLDRLQILASNGDGIRFNRLGIHFDDWDTPTVATVSNSIINGSRGDGVVVSESASVELLNNTVHANGQDGIAFTLWQSNAGPHTHTLRNNLVTGNTGHAVAARPVPGYVVTSGNGVIHLDHNDFWNNGLGGWDAQGCLDTHALAAADCVGAFEFDPEYVAAPTDLHLLAGSPAVDSAAAGPDHDLDGHPRRSAPGAMNTPPVDLGALEYGF